MTLADLIQSQSNKDIQKLEAQYKSEFKETKNTWDSSLAEVKKLHTEKIDEAVSTQINFQKFQTSKANKFDYGYSIQAQLDNIYQELIPEILASKFVAKLIQKTLQDIPTSTTLTLTGKYSNELKAIIKNLKYSVEVKENNKILGSVTAQLESGHLEITVEDIINIVKQKTLASIIKEI